MTHLGDIAVSRAVRHGQGGTTLPALLAAHAARRGNAVALLHKRHGLWRKSTWREVAEESAGLAAAIARHGIGRGYVVVIAGANRPRLFIAMLACQRLGAVPVLVPQCGAGVSLEQVLAEHAVRLAFVAGEHEVHAINAARSRLPDPPTVVCDDPRGLRGRWTPRLQTWDTFVGGAAAALPPSDVAPSDIAAIVYPAGAAAAEAVALTHAELTAQAEAATQTSGLGPLDRALLALPLGWGEVLLLGPVQALHAGFALAFPENDTTVLRDLHDVAPTLLFGPPALYRRLRQQAFLAVAGAGWPWRAMLARGLGLRDSGTPSRWTRALAARATRDRLGLSHVRAAISFGGVPAPPVSEFFAALGIELRRFDAEVAATVEERIEAALRGSVYIRDAAVLRTDAGDFAALVSVDGEAVASWAETNGHSVRSREELSALDDVRALIASEIEATRRASGPEPAISTFLIAPRGFSVAGGELAVRGDLRHDDIERLHAPALASLRVGGGHRVSAADHSHAQHHEGLDMVSAVLDSVWI